MGKPYYTFSWYCTFKSAPKGGPRGRGLAVPCSGLELCWTRPRCSSLSRCTGWCWAISTLVHTLLSPCTKKVKAHDRCSLWTHQWRGGGEGAGVNVRQATSNSTTTNVHECVYIYKHSKKYSMSMHVITKQKKTNNNNNHRLLPPPLRQPGARSQ